MDTEDQVIESEEQEQPTEETIEPQEEAPEEEQVTEEAEEEPEEPEEETPEEPEEPKPSRRESLRVKDLLSKYPTLNSQPTQQTEQKNVPFRDLIETDEQVYEQLEKTTQEYGQEQYNQGAQQIRKEIQTSEWRTMLNIDAPQVEKEYGWLNPKNKEEFDPDLADVTNEEYKRFVGYDEQSGLVSNPVRYSDFVEARVELATRMAEAMVAKSTKNIAKQAASTGIRPDGSRAKSMNLNKSPGAMTTDELQAKIAKELGL